MSPPTRSGARSVRARSGECRPPAEASLRQRRVLHRERSSQMARPNRHGAPPGRAHPQTQGKIERWHQTLKNRILLENYYMPGDLEAQIEAFVTEYNYRR